MLYRIFTALLLFAVNNLYTQKLYFVSGAAVTGAENNDFSLRSKKYYTNIASSNIILWPNLIFKTRPYSC